VTKRRQLTRAIAGLAAFSTLGLMPACSLEPIFRDRAPRENIPCYTEEPVAYLDIAFDRHTAIVVDRGEQITLNFVPSIWPRMEDVYEGEGYLLSMDPEAGLVRPDGSSVGPCH
jgi:hypothetical protein